MVIDRDAIKGRRIELRLSQNEVNKRCDFKPARYATIERGKEPTPEELTTILNVLDLQVVEGHSAEEF